jgi:hypothetical protein
LLPLKNGKEKIQKPNIYLKNNFKSKENITLIYRKLNIIFSVGVDSSLKNNFIYKIFIKLP